MENNLSKTVDFSSFSALNFKKPTSFQHILCELCGKRRIMKKTLLFRCFNQKAFFLHFLPIYKAKGNLLGFFGSKGSVILRNVHILSAKRRKNQGFGKTKYISARFSRICYLLLPFRAFVRLFFDFAAADCLFFRPEAVFSVIRADSLRILVASSPKILSNFERFVSPKAEFGWLLAVLALLSCFFLADTLLAFLPAEVPECEPLFPF